MQTVYQYPKGGTIKVDQEQARIIITSKDGDSASLNIGPQGVIELARALDEVGQEWLKAWGMQ